MYLLLNNLIIYDTEINFYKILIVIVYINQTGVTKLAIIAPIAPSAVIPQTDKTQMHIVVG